MICKSNNIRRYTRKKKKRILNTPENISPAPYPSEVSPLLRSYTETTPRPSLRFPPSRLTSMNRKQSTPAASRLMSTRWRHAFRYLLVPLRGSAPPKMQLASGCLSF